jgi:hypothetical protein
LGDVSLSFQQPRLFFLSILAPAALPAPTQPPRSISKVVNSPETAIVKRQQHTQVQHGGIMVLQYRPAVTIKDMFYIYLGADSAATSHAQLMGIVLDELHFLDAIFDETHFLASAGVYCPHYGRSVPCRSFLSRTLGPSPS